VILCHARREPDLQGLILAPDTHAPQSFVLGYRPGWAKTFPQSAHLLREEALAWQQTPWSLTVNELNIDPPSFAPLPFSRERDGLTVARF
jgi:exopolyphosphatase / guanosine-5'-triphosphate,3'-diphosphate pyrophosphatase